MANLNKVLLIGNLIKDPELRVTQSGINVATFTVATNEKYREKGSGELKESAEFHNIVAWDKKADLCSRYLSKGKSVYIEGKIKTDVYEKQGQKHYSTKVVLDNIQFLTPAGTSTSPATPSPTHDGLEDIPF